MEETKKEKINSKQKMKLDVGGFGITAFLLSLISVEYLLMGVFSHNPFYFAIFAIPASILSVTFGVYDRKIDKSTIPLIGVVLGLIVLVLYVVYFFTMLILGIDQFNIF